MKLKYLSVLAIGLLLATTGCDDKLNTYETAGVTAVPEAISASSISSEALPGQIRLMWSADPQSFEYMKVRYYNPLTKEDVLQLVSNKTTELLIDETRARFGDYTFYFQTFNVLGEGSEVTEIKAQSGPAPITYRETKITTGYSCDQPDSSEGNIGNAFDGNTGTFYSSDWHNGTQFPSYIQLDLENPCEMFYINYINRTDDGWRTTGRPSSVDLQVSADGQSWTTVETLTNLPNAGGSSYQTDYISCDVPFTSFRFSVTSNTGDSYFCISELEFYFVEVYDPETEPLD